MRIPIIVVLWSLGCRVKVAMRSERLSLARLKLVQCLAIATFIFCMKVVKLLLMMTRLEATLGSMC